ncbi:chromatin assembly factor 1 subunit B-like [Anneissia japonica]|uniref:chromatin assembly factor 1 subunit B-like n=1 Tax=Anneissia japonica TaxID=1529436 RepID=UPI0014256B02|nr:chromatin assembly factor 1 subunit B-like [Anneissia japonica]
MKLDTPEISWHGRDPVYSVDIQKIGKHTRLATAGADNKIRIWYLTVDSDGKPWVQFASNLSRHTKAVNVVRFSTSQHVLASAGDGEKLHLLKDHKNYVQGVAFDPQNQFVATFSCDRSCRIYSLQSRRCVNHVTRMSVNTTNNEGEAQTKQIRMFHDDDSLKSFFRRLTFSPDGEFLIVPCGVYEVGDSTSNTTFLFSRLSLSKPLLHYPGPAKPTVAVRCCPVLFELRSKQPETTETIKNDEEEVNQKKDEDTEKMDQTKEDQKNNGMEADVKSEEVKSENNDKKSTTRSLFNLPYRMVFAVASEDSIMLYDTEQVTPFAMISKIHYQQINDLAWSSDGQYLSVCSTDGYCTIVVFEPGELGVPYKKKEAPQSLDENMKCDDIIAPATNGESILIQTTNKKSSPVHSPLSSDVKKPELTNQNSSNGERRRVTLTTLVSKSVANSDTTSSNQQPQKRRIPLTAVSSPPASSNDKVIAANKSEKPQPRRIQLASVPSTSSTLAAGSGSSVEPSSSNGSCSLPTQASPQETSNKPNDPDKVNTNEGAKESDVKTNPDQQMSTKTPRRVSLLTLS